MDVLFGIVLGLCLAMVIAYVAWRYGVDEGYEAGLQRGYEEGLKDGSVKEEVVIDVPKTGDGKFYSTRAAMKIINEVGNE